MNIIATIWGFGVLGFWGLAAGDDDLWPTLGGRAPMWRAALARGGRLLVSSRTSRCWRKRHCGSSRRAAWCGPAMDAGRSCWAARLSAWPAKSPPEGRTETSCWRSGGRGADRTYRERRRRHRRCADWRCDRSERG